MLKEDAHGTSSFSSYFLFLLKLFENIFKYLRSIFFIQFHGSLIAEILTSLRHYYNIHYLRIPASTCNRILLSNRRYSFFASFEILISHFIQYSHFPQEAPILLWKGLLLLKPPQMKPYHHSFYFLLHRANVNPESFLQCLPAA